MNNSVVGTIPCFSGTVFQHVSERDEYGMPIQVHVSGNLITVYGSPDRFYLPVRRSIRHYSFYLTEENINSWIRITD